MKAWGGRFTQTTDKIVEQYSQSISYDQRLAAVDIYGSLAHIKMLAHCNILTIEEYVTLQQGLIQLLNKLKHQQLQFMPEHEDIHMNIEWLLGEEIGPTAGKLHTGRSRNDQVAVDLHLYLRDTTLNIIELLVNVQITLLHLAENNLDIIMPGYTHLQTAQPIRLSHHLLAYVWMLQRDIEKLIMSWQHVNISPLGAGALAGSSLPLDCQLVAKLLAFDHHYCNSMDAVSDRDFLATFIFNASLTMMHLSRFSEEIILWMTKEFSFIDLADEHCTGSSMLPQKKNPDIAELTRGKTGRVYGSLMGVLTILKGLPLSYNRDLQEDKEGLFDTVDTLQQALTVFNLMLQGMTFKNEQMFAAANQDSLVAIDLANFLVTQGVPFREAHHIIGKMIRYTIEQNLTLAELPLTLYQEFSPAFTDKIYQLFNLNERVDCYTTVSGTAKSMIAQQFDEIKHKISESKNWVSIKKLAIQEAYIQLT